MVLSLSCLPHQCGCNIFQAFLQSQPQRRIPFVIHYRHIGSSRANSIHYQRQLVADGQLQCCLALLSPGYDGKS